MSRVPASVIACVAGLAFAFGSNITPAEAKKGKISYAVTKGAVYSGRRSEKKDETPARANMIAPIEPAEQDARAAHAKRKLAEEAGESQSATLLTGIPGETNVGIKCLAGCN